MSQEIQNSVRRRCSTLGKSLATFLKPDNNELDHAASWIARLDRGESESAQVLARAWLLCCREHRSAFHSLYKAWRSCDELNAFRNVTQDVDDDLFAPGRVLQSQDCSREVVGFPAGTGVRLRARSFLLRRSEPRRSVAVLAFGTAEFKVPALATSQFQVAAGALRVEGEGATFVVTFCPTLNAVTVDVVAGAAHVTRVEHADETPLNHVLRAGECVVFDAHISERYDGR